MENMTDVLMLAGQVGQCPDCAEERILVPVDLEGAAGEPDIPAFCCTSCDAAVLVLDELAVAGVRTGSHLQQLAG